jgi:hypothetical protein
MPNSQQANSDLIEKVNNTKLWVENELPSLPLSTHNDFMNATVEACKNLRILFLFGISLDSIQNGKPQDGFTKEQAPIVGLMVRIWKLYDMMCYHVSQNHGEISSMFIRPIYEAYIKVMYLIANPTSYESFIRTSYKSDIEMYKDLKPKEEEGSLDQAGTKILRRIESLMDRDNLDIEELLQINHSGWRFDGKDFRTISKEILPDNFYTFIFSNSSSFIHGDWRDIRKSHLAEENRRYYPDPETDPVDPRYILPISIIIIKALSAYTHWASTDPDNFMEDILVKAEEGIRYIDEKFEAQRTD